MCENQSGLKSTEFDTMAVAATEVGDAPVPTRILIVPWGEVKSTAGTFVVDEAAAAATIAAFERHGTDLPVDYEHQTLGGAYSSPTGLAPAAGWVKRLSAIAPNAANGDYPQPGIWADVEWTLDASERLRGRQYRYLSPVALIRRDDRRVVGLHSVALTNKPAIVGMRPVVNRDAPVDEPVDAGADPDVLLREVLALDAAAPADLVIMAAARRIQSLERRELRRAARQRVERALAAGKLVGAQCEWAAALAERDPAEFDRWEAAAPVVMAAGRMVPARAHAVDGPSQRRAAARTARMEYRANRPMLEKICTEESFVAAAVRDCPA